MIFNPAWSDAISSIESGGNYGILGPVTKNGDRAYGRYQVMGNNVGPWTREVLGRSMTPQEFVNNPAAQDAVFQAKFGQSVAKYGNPQDAASVWFTGKPLAQGANKSDALGTTGQGYVDKFTKALGGMAPQNVSPVISESPQPQRQLAFLSNTQPLGPSLSMLAALPQQQTSQPASGLNFVSAPSAPSRRRIDVTGLLHLLQNSPAQVRGLLQG
jgi:hypothetical protein